MIYKRAQWSAKDLCYAILWLCYKGFVRNKLNALAVLTEHINIELIKRNKSIQIKYSTHYTTGITTHHHHRRRQVRVASEGRRVIAPHVHSRQHASRGLQWDAWNRFIAGQATCSVDDQVGNVTCGQEVGWVIRWRGAEEPCLPVWHRQVEPHAQIPRCVDGIGDETMKSDRMQHSNSTDYSP